MYNNRYKVNILSNKEVECCEYVAGCKTERTPGRKGSTSFLVPRAFVKYNAINIGKI